MAFASIREPASGHLPRILAIDWSGRKKGAGRAIWVAEVRDKKLRSLENGRTRTEIVDFLIEETRQYPRTIVGFDFAFSFPEWFVKQCGCQSAPDVWAQVDRHGEDWLASCEPPFWGRPGCKKPELASHFRATEIAMHELEKRAPAKSVFQIGGAGAVGTGSIRGMPVLGRLADAGMSVWPFSTARLPLVVEIYPRVLHGPVVKSKPSERRRYMEQHFTVTERQLDDVTDSEDAFDAAVSGLVMARHLEELLRLPPARNSREAVEGRIWTPGMMEREGTTPAV